GRAPRGEAELMAETRQAEQADIVVVALGRGIDFLVEGAKDDKGRPFDAPVAALAGMGVEFRVCHNSLAAFKVPEDKLLLEAKVVPAGVVEVTRLQQDEGFAYLKP
ncbi:DsrE family protein, partial [Ralstonia pseudosolanacearum]|uniref:DsrE family protein n=1 Tax=Ralstonia pseudosolanacearum TaxID=1310165 RepID=UPI003D166303